MRNTLSGLGLGDGAVAAVRRARDVLIRVASSPWRCRAAGSRPKGARCVGEASTIAGSKWWRPRFQRTFGLCLLGLDARDLSILIYLWFRFEWQFALGAMIANVHDIVLTIVSCRSRRSISISPASRRC